MTAARRVGWLTSFAYGAPSLGAAILGVLFYVYIPNLYTEQFGVSLASVGAIVFLSRVWDAVIDPAVGYFCDQTRSRFGRRKSWIILSTIPLIFVFYFLCSPVWVSSSMGYTIWFAVGTFLFFLFWTTLSIPFEALGTEIVADYHARTTMFAIRQGMIVIGTLVAGAIPAFVLIDGLEGGRTDWPMVAALVGGVLLIGVLLLTIFVVEPVPQSNASKDRSRQSFLQIFKVARLNRPFMILLMAYTISGFGASLPATLILYYVNSVIGVDSPALYLSIYFLVGFICLPFWVWLAKRIGKKEAWIWSMLINTAAFICVIPLGLGDTTWYGVLVGMSGIGYGGSLALPASMQADVLDLELFERGKRREGEFVALWSIANKLAAAFGSGVAFPILAMTGYVTKTGSSEGLAAGIHQNGATLFALSVLYAAVPCLCNLVAILVVRKYSLPEHTVRAMQTELRGRS